MLPTKREISSASNGKSFSLESIPLLNQPSTVRNIHRGVARCVMNEGSKRAVIGESVEALRCADGSWVRDSEGITCDRLSYQEFPAYQIT